MPTDLVRDSDLCEPCSRADANRGVLILSVHAGERVKLSDIPSPADACRRCGVRERRKVRVLQ